MAIVMTIMINYNYYYDNYGNSLLLFDSYLSLHAT